ncbi:MAG: hypothetical protein VX642_14970 [Bdellovibrionota bacterium]|nr:hypothetical protein [Bdellovibrionota bacterium]
MKKSFIIFSVLIGLNAFADQYHIGQDLFGFKILRTKNINLSSKLSCEDVNQRLHEALLAFRQNNNVQTVQLSDCNEIGKNIGFGESTFHQSLSISYQVEKILGNI